MGHEKGLHTDELVKLKKVARLGVTVTWWLPKKVIRKLRENFSAVRGGGKAHLGL